MKFSLKNFLRRCKIKKLEKEIELTTEECARLSAIDTILLRHAGLLILHNRANLIKQLAELEGESWQ